MKWRIITIILLIAVASYGVSLLVKETPQTVLKSGDDQINKLIHRRNVWPGGREY